MRTKKHRRHRRHKSHRKKATKPIDYKAVFIGALIGIVLGLILRDSHGLPLIFGAVLYDAETMIPLDKVQFENIGNNSIYGIPVYFYDLNETEADFALELLKMIPYRYLKEIKEISFVNRIIYNSEVDKNIDGLYNNGVITIGTKYNERYRITTTLCHEITHHHLKTPEISVGHELVTQLGESLYCYNGWQDYKYEAVYIEAHWIPEYSGRRSVWGYDAVRDLIGDNVINYPEGA